MAECSITPTLIISRNQSIDDVSISNASCNVSTDTDQGRDPLQSFPHYLRPAATAACSLLILIGVLGNVLIPVVVWRTRELRSSTNLFLVNLSLADLLVLLVCMPPVLVEVLGRPEVWELGHTMCKLVPFVELLVAHASVLTIVAISLERYYAICQPLRAGYTCTRMRAVTLCIGVWVTAIISTSPILVIAEYKITKYYDGSCVPVCLTQAYSFWASCFFIAVITIFFFLPFGLLLIIYIVIACHLVADPGTAANPHLKSRKQVVVMLAAVVTSFFVCLLPFRVLTLFIVLDQSERLMSLGVEAYYNLLYSCRILLYAHSALNPVLYNAMSSKFRVAFRRLLGVNTRHLSRHSTFSTSVLSTSALSTSSKQKEGEALLRGLSQQQKLLQQQQRQRSLEQQMTPIDELPLREAPKVNFASVNSVIITN